MTGYETVVGRVRQRFAADGVEATPAAVVRAVPSSSTIPSAPHMTP